jgi:hypothetical protein
MVDQAQITRENGRTELPPRAVARNTADFFHDVATLGELQARLAAIDLRQGLAKVVVPAVVLAAGALIAMGTVPIALAALALVIAANTELSLAVCFGIALLVGLVLCGLLTVPAWIYLKGGLDMFQRSRHELDRNVRWVKDTLKRLGQSPQ